MSGELWGSSRSMPKMGESTPPWTDPRSLLEALEPDGFNDGPPLVAWPVLRAASCTNLVRDVA